MFAASSAAARASALAGLGAAVAGNGAAEPAPNTSRSARARGVARRMRPPEFAGAEPGGRWRLPRSSHRVPPREPGEYGPVVLSAPARVGPRAQAGAPVARGGSGWAW